MNTLYKLQFRKPGEQWQDHTNAPVRTEEEAWEMLAAWERYCPSEEWRWVRTFD